MNGIWLMTGRLNGIRNSRATANRPIATFSVQLGRSWASARRRCRGSGRQQHAQTLRISGVPNRPYGRDEQPDDHHDVGDDHRVAGAEHVGLPGRGTGRRRSRRAPTISPPTSAPGHRVQAAEDHRRQRPEGDELRLGLDRPGLGDRWLGGEDPADGGQHGARRPGDGEHPADADALGHRHLLVVGDGPHGDAGARPVEEEHGEEADARGDDGGDVRPVDEGVPDGERARPPRRGDRRGTGSSRSRWRTPGG